MSEEMNQEQQMAQIDISLDQANHSVGLWQSYQRLTQNDDFKNLIVKTYMEKEPARLVMLKTDQGMLDEQSKTQLENALIGISALNQFFMSVQQLGMMAQQSINELEASKEAIYEDEMASEEEVVN